MRINLSTEESAEIVLIATKLIDVLKKEKLTHYQAEIVLEWTKAYLKDLSIWILFYIE